MNNPARMIGNVFEGILGISIVITALAAPIILSIGNIYGLVVPKMKCI